MRELFIIMTVISSVFMGKITYAAGLLDFVNKTGGETSNFITSVLGIVAVGIIGILGSQLLSLFGKTRVAKLVEHGAYIAAIGIFMGMAITMFEKFISFIGIS